MATDRVSGGDIPVDKLLAQLRRAAEQDGVDDVDAIVAEFATFVRAQAPRLATRQRPSRTRLSARTPLLAAGALAAAAFAAVVSGAVANPFLPAAPSLASARAERAGALDGTDAAGTPDPSVPSVIVLPDGLTSGDAPIAEAAISPSMAFTDPDALAVLAEQRSEGPVPPSPPSTTPTPPVTTPASVELSESDDSIPTPAPDPSNTTPDDRPGDGTATPTVADDPSDGMDTSGETDDEPTRTATSTTVPPLVDDDTQPVLQTTDLLEPPTDQGGAG